MAALVWCPRLATDLASRCPQPHYLCTAVLVGGRHWELAYTTRKQNSYYRVYVVYLCPLTRCPHSGARL